MTITAEEARALWDYSPGTGIFRWKVCSHKKIRIGDVAGGIADNGYRILTYKGKKYSAARIAFLIVTRAYPPDEVDHENNNPADDRWDNLRPADRSQQLFNTRVRSDNKLGVKGVCFVSGRYRAFICTNGNRKNLGGYSTVAEAKAVYDKAASEEHGAFARL
jgi:hypothetical protein